MSELPGGAVTLADLFRVLSSMQTDISKLVTRLEVLGTRNDHADEDLRDHETRIRAVEQFRWKAAGLSTVIGMLSGGGTASIIVYALSRH